TEVQRKSTLDLQLEISTQLGERDSLDVLPEEKIAIEMRLRALVETLWQTRILRAVKLAVRDEIENALSYFGYSFIDVVPRVQAEIEDAVAQLPGDFGRPELPPVLTVGSWVGGDRDGNPFVTADMLEYAFRRQGECIFDHYL